MLSSSEAILIMRDRSSVLLFLTGRGLRLQIGSEDAPSGL